MATLEHIGNHRLIRLKGVHQVGRRKGNDLVVSSPRTSGFHAVFEWEGDRWVVRDLGSKNGTWINDEPIAPNISHPIEIGEMVRFADEGPWRVRSLEPAEAMAIPVGGGAPVLSREGGPFGIPDDEHPLASVVPDSYGVIWRLEHDDGRVQDLKDGDVVMVGDQAWRMSLPEVIDETQDQTPGLPHIDTIHMNLDVSADREFIQITVRHGDTTFRPRSRAHNELLLVLAEQRIEDQQGEDVASVEQGWIYTDDLHRRLGDREKSNKVHVWIHRARQQFHKLDIEGSADLIERRIPTGQLRLGVGRLSIKYQS